MIIFPKGVNMGVANQTIASRNMEFQGAQEALQRSYLGYGYDVTEQFFHPESVRAQVVDMDQVVQNIPKRVQYTQGSSSDIRMVCAENAQEYCSELSAKADVSYKKGLFAGSLSAKFGYKNNCSSKYSFGSFFLIMRKAVASLTVSSKDLQPYLIQETFLRDIEEKTPQDVIRLYGTHVITHVTLGGRLEVLCRSIIDTSAKKLSLEAGIKASLGKIVSGNVDVAYSQEEFKKNSELTVSIETIGGDPSKSIVSSFGFNPTMDFKSDFNAWQSSLGEQNMNLVDMAKSSLLPLYELIPNTPALAAKKEALQKEILAYLQQKQFAMVDVPKPLYRYNYPGHNHFYTMNWDDLGYGKGAYSFESIACNIYDIQVPNSVPLYRYINPHLSDHFYTTNWSELLNGKDGYVFEGITGFVFKDPNAEPCLVPLHRCYRSLQPNNADHFYSIVKGEVDKTGGAYEGIECYVHRPSPLNR